MPTVGTLTDPQGRVLRDLRISVTDRCNLRCVYCMPLEGVAWLPRADVLTYEEIVRVARLAIGLGVTGIRLTGGEPTVRAGLEVLVRALRDLDPALDLSLTTNGLRLAALAGDLRQAGLTRINVSLDTLDRARFRQDRPARPPPRGPRGPRGREARGFLPHQGQRRADARVQRGRGRAARALGPRTGLRAALRRVDAARFAALVVHRAAGPGGGDPGGAAAEFPLDPVPGADPSAPAELHRYRDGGGTVGVIASVTRPFCARCDRIRLTADGQIRTCLFAHEEHDLRGALRRGASDEELTGLLKAAAWRKEPGHLINNPAFLQPARGMSAIGG